MMCLENVRCLFWAWEIFQHFLHPSSLTLAHRSCRMVALGHTLTENYSENPNLSYGLLEYVLQPSLASAPGCRVGRYHFCLSSTKWLHLTPSTVECNILNLKFEALLTMLPVDVSSLISYQSPPCRLNFPSPPPMPNILLLL